MNRRTIRIALWSLVVLAGVFFAWYAKTYTGCGVHNPNACDYDGRYKLMSEHPYLGGTPGR